MSLYIKQSLIYAEIENNALSHFKENSIAKMYKIMKD